MKNIIHIISGAGMALCIVLGLQVSSAAAATNKKCFKGSGYGSQYMINQASKRKAFDQAIANWQKKARQVLYSDVPTWSKAIGKRVTQKRKGSVWHASVYGGFCITTIAAVKNYRPKCAANDIKCKARSFKAIQKNKIPSLGVR